MDAPVEIQLEAETIAYWFHLDSPLTNWETYTLLTDGLLAAKRDYRAALAAHDHDRAAELLAEVGNLNELCAAAAEGLALQRSRFLASSNPPLPWPLGR